MDGSSPSHSFCQSNRKLHSPCPKSARGPGSPGPNPRRFPAPYGTASPRGGSYASCGSARAPDHSEGKGRPPIPARPQAAGAPGSHSSSARGTRCCRRTRPPCRTRCRCTCPPPPIQSSRCWLARQRGPRSAAMESAQGLLGATAWVSVRPKPRWGSRCDWRCAAPFHAFAALIRPGEVDAERLGVAVIRVLVRAFVNINANVHQGHVALLRTHHLEAWLAAGAVPAHASLVRTVLISAQYPSVPFRRPGRKACALSVCIQRQELQRRSRISGGGAVES